MNEAQRILDGIARPRPPMPSLSEVAAAWCELGHVELHQTFPTLRAHGIGWGEPFCFRCGWLAPTRDTASYPAAWTDERRFRRAWDAAGGWLERAHLHDHEHGGSSEPLNLVPLCPLCHEQQPVCSNRAEGVAFINTRAPFAGLRPFAQMVTDEEGDRRNPGKQEAVRCLLRAYAIVGAALFDEAARP